MSWRAPGRTELPQTDDTYGYSIAIWRLGGKCETPLVPLWVSEAVHQSGVNCIDVQSDESERYSMTLLPHLRCSC